MSLLWLIIKLIVVILLSVVLFVLGILMIILLSPIKYDCLYEKYDHTYFYIKIKFLKFIRFVFIFREGIAKSTVSILGYPIYKQRTDNVEEVIEKKIEDTKDNTSKLSKKIVREKQPRRKAKKSVVARWLPAKELLSDERFKLFVKSIFETLKKIGLLFKPNKFYFTLILGKDDPGDIGQIIAQITLLYPWYYQYGTIQGHYEEEGVWGDVGFEGKFKLITLFKILFIFIFNKETREYIHLLLKTRKRYEHG